MLWSNDTFPAHVLIDVSNSIMHTYQWEFHKHASIKLTDCFDINFVIDYLLNIIVIITGRFLIYSNLVINASYR